MLARRFSIVCLLITAFAMGMAILVAEKGRSPNPYAQNSAFNFCDKSSSGNCSSLYR